MKGERPRRADIANRPLYRLDRRDAFLWAILVSSFIATRVLWLATALRSTFYWEESYRWVAANELLHHPFHSLLVYQADHYQGGTLVMLLLATAAMKLFGETVVVLKMSVVVYSAATMTALYVLVRKAFGRFAAIVASIAYIATPPLAAYWGVVITGSHTESLLFSLVTTLLALRLLHGPARKLRAWALLGLVTGLGVWFCYTSVITLAACALVWLLLRGMPRAAELGAAVAGGLAGLAPWFAYNIREGFAGLVRLMQIFGYADPKDLWLPQSAAEKLWYMLTRDVPVGATLLFDAKLPTWAISALELAFALPLFVAISVSLLRVAMLALPPDPRADSNVVEIDAALRAREAVLVVYFGLFVALITLSSFAIGRLTPLSLRFYVPPLVLVSVPFAIGLARATGKVSAAAVGGGEVTLSLLGRVGTGGSQSRRLAGVAALGALAYGFACVIALVTFAVGHADSPVSLANLNGYHVQGVLLHLKYEDDLSRAESLAREIGDPTARFRVFFGIGWGLSTRVRAGGSLAHVKEVVEQDRPPEERAALLAGMTWDAGVVLKAIKAGSEPEFMVPGRTGPLRKRMSDLLDYAQTELDRLPARLRFLGMQPTTLPGYFEGQAKKAAGGREEKVR